MLIGGGMGRWGEGEEKRGHKDGEEGTELKKVKRKIILLARSLCYQDIQVMVCEVVF